MFGPSLKSVPGCFVSIVPMLIGDPVAATPGFGPHFDVSTEPELEPVLPVLALDEAELEVELPPPPAELLLELLPQPARTSNPSTVNSARPVRRRTQWNFLTLSPLLMKVMTRRIGEWWLILIRAHPACNKVLLRQDLPF